MTAPIRFDDIPVTGKRDTTVSFDDIPITKGQPIDLAEQEARGVERAAKTIGTRGVRRAAAQGLPFVGAFSDEAEAFMRSLRSGQPMEQELQKIRQEMQQFTKESPTLAYGAEIGTGLLTGGAAGFAARKAGPAVMQRMLGSEVIQGGLAGAGAAEGGPAARAIGALTGMAGGATVKSMLTPSTRIAERDLPRDIAGTVGGLGQNVRIGAMESLRNRIAEAGQRGLRSVSDVLAKEPAVLGVPIPGARTIARAIEPTDAAKAERVLSELFPQSIPIAALEAQAGRAKAAAAKIGEQAVEAQRGVTESIKKTAARATALANRAEQRATSTLQQLKTEAEQLVGPLRTPTENAAALRDATRKIQQEEAERSYGIVKAMRPGDAYPRGVYQRIKSDKGLAAEFTDAVESRRTEMMSERLGQEGADVMAGVKAPRLQTYKTGRMMRTADGEMVEETVPRIDLQMIDKMRRNVLDKMDSYLDNANTGVSRAEGRRRLEQINALEEDFLKTVPPEQRQALINARKPTAEKFTSLRFLADGQNIRRFVLGAKEEVLGAGKNDLRELLDEVSALERKGTPAAKEAVAHFRVGVRQAIADMVESSPDDATAVIKKLVGTAQDRMRLQKVFTPDEIKQFQQYLPEQVQQAAETAVGPTRRAAAALQERAARGGGRRTQALQSEADRLAEDLAAQQERAAQLDVLTGAARQFREGLRPTTAGREASEGLASVLFPRMSPPTQQTLQAYGGSAIRRELEGLTLEQAQQRLRQMQQSPAARALLGAEMAQLERAITPRPRVIRPTLARFTGGGLSSALTGFVAPGAVAPDTTR